MYDVVLFDLDGTVTDSGPGIRNSVAYALKKAGIAVPDQQALNAFIGPPLKDSFKKYYGFDEEQANQGVVWYREYYSDGGIFENRVYEGMPELLRHLKQAGKTVILATSKPELFAVRILEHFGILEFFDCVAGATMDETRTKKAEVITYALSKAGITEKSRVVMVGDRREDVLGAHEADLPCIGVLFGFGSREELLEAGADFLAETVPEIGGLVCEGLAQSQFAAEAGHEGT